VWMRVPGDRSEAGGPGSGRGGGRRWALLGVGQLNARGHRGFLGRRGTREGGADAGLRLRQALGTLPTYDRRQVPKP
jgi:hypothetical protein